MPRAVAQPTPRPLFEEPTPRFVYDPRPAYVPTPRRDDAAAQILSRMCNEAQERSARLAKKRTIGDLEEEEWRTRGDYPETRVRRASREGSEEDKEESEEDFPLKGGEVGGGCMGGWTTLRSHLEHICTGVFYLRVSSTKKMLSLWPLARG
jgi:hypothetical protein